MYLTPWKKRTGVACHPASPSSFWGKDFEHLWSSLWNDAWPTADGERVWSPSLELTETEEELRLRAELPGVDPKDVEITLDGDHLTVSGKKEASKESEKENCRYSERSYGAFRRTLALPVEVQADSAEANHKDGVLTITLKKEPKVTPKKIPVKGS